MENVLKDILQPLVVIASAIFAVIQYMKQQKFKRIQNLTNLWKQFVDDEEIRTVFDIMNNVELEVQTAKEQLPQYSTKAKLKYLALLEETMLYLHESEISYQHVGYMFQWHFFMPYLSPKANELFWENLGGTTERDSKYWKKQKQLALRLQKDFGTK